MVDLRSASPDERTADDFSMGSIAFELRTRHWLQTGDLTGRPSARHVGRRIRLGPDIRVIRNGWQRYQHFSDGNRLGHDIIGKAYVEVIDRDALDYSSRQPELEGEPVCGVGSFLQGGRRVQDLAWPRVGWHGYPVGAAG